MSPTSVRLDAEVRIDRPVEAVRAFFAEVDNLARWDRGVVKVVRATAGPLAIGGEFSRIGPAPPGRRGKVSVYRIIEFADDHAIVALLRDAVFEEAHWITRFTPRGRETDVHCQFVALPRPRYFFVGWLLRLLRGRIADDLYYLKRAIEDGEIAKR
jgi:hypothetical protein